MEVPDSEVHKLQQGGIYAFVAWISYICLVWSFKVSSCFFTTESRQYPCESKPVLY